MIEPSDVIAWRVAAAWWARHRSNEGFLGKFCHVSRSARKMRVRGPGAWCPGPLASEGIFALTADCSHKVIRQAHAQTPQTQASTGPTEARVHTPHCGGRRGGATSSDATSPRNGKWGAEGGKGEGVACGAPPQSYVAIEGDVESSTWAASAGRASERRKAAGSHPSPRPAAADSPEVHMERRALQRACGRRDGARDRRPIRTHTK